MATRSLKTYQTVRDELTERYDGVTAPPGRLPNETKAARIQDDIIVYEVMMEKVNRDGWKQYRVSLERTFRQEEIVVRAIAFDKL